MQWNQVGIWWDDERCSQCLLMIWRWSISSQITKICSWKIYVHLMLHAWEQSLKFSAWSEHLLAFFPANLPHYKSQHKVISNKLNNAFNVFTLNLSLSKVIYTSYHWIFLCYFTDTNGGLESGIWLFELWLFEAGFTAWYEREIRRVTLRESRSYKNMLRNYICGYLHVNKVLNFYIYVEREIDLISEKVREKKKSCPKEAIDW